MEAPKGDEPPLPGRPVEQVGLRGAEVREPRPSPHELVHLRHPLLEPDGGVVPRTARDEVVGELVGEGVQPRVAGGQHPGGEHHHLPVLADPHRAGALYLLHGEPGGLGHGLRVGHEDHLDALPHPIAEQLLEGLELRRQGLVRVRHEQGVLAFFVAIREAAARPLYHGHPRRRRLGELHLIAQVLPGQLLPGAGDRLPQAGQGRLVVPLEELEPGRHVAPLRGRERARVQGLQGAPGLEEEVGVGVPGHVAQGGRRRRDGERDERPEEEQASEPGSHSTS